jgi:hypothetical protein
MFYPNAGIAWLGLRVARESGIDDVVYPGAVQRSG